MPLRWPAAASSSESVELNHHNLQNLQKGPQTVSYRYPDFLGVLAVEASDRLRIVLPEFRQEYYKKAFEFYDLEPEIECNVPVPLQPPSRRTQSVSPERRRMRTALRTVPSNSNLSQALNSIEFPANTRKDANRIESECGFVETDVDEAVETNCSEITEVPIERPTRLRLLRMSNQNSNVEKVVTAPKVRNVENGQTVERSDVGSDVVTKSVAEISNVILSVSPDIKIQLAKSSLSSHNSQISDSSPSIQSQTASTLNQNALKSTFLPASIPKNDKVPNLVKARSNLSPWGSMSGSEALDFIPVEGAARETSIRQATKTIIRPVQPIPKLPIKESIMGAIMRDIGEKGTAMRTPDKERPEPAETRGGAPTIPLSMKIENKPGKITSSLLKSTKASETACETVQEQSAGGNVAGSVTHTYATQLSRLSAPLGAGNENIEILKIFRNERTPKDRVDGIEVFAKQEIFQRVNTSNVSARGLPSKRDTWINNTKTIASRVIEEPRLKSGEGILMVLTSAKGYNLHARDNANDILGNASAQKTMFSSGIAYSTNGCSSFRIPCNGHIAENVSKQLGATAISEIDAVPQPGRNYAITGVVPTTSRWKYQEDEKYSQLRPYTCPDLRTQNRLDLEEHRKVASSAFERYHPSFRPFSSRTVQCEVPGVRRQIQATHVPAQKKVPDSPTDIMPSTSSFSNELSATSSPVLWHPRLKRTASAGFIETISAPPSRFRGVHAPLSARSASERISRRQESTPRGESSCMHSAGNTVSAECLKIFRTPAPKELSVESLSAAPEANLSIQPLGDDASSQIAQSNLAVRQNAPWCATEHQWTRWPNRHTNDIETAALVAMDDMTIVPRQFKTIIFNILRRIFVDFCTANLTLAGEPFLHFLKSIGLAGKPDYTFILFKPLEDKEAMELYHAVQDKRTPGLQFEHFWVVMQAIGHRLTKTLKEASGVIMSSNQFLFQTCRRYRTFNVLQRNAQ